MSGQHEPSRAELNAANKTIGPRAVIDTIAPQLMAEVRHRGGTKIGGRYYLYMHSTRSLVRVDAWDWIKEQRKAGNGGENK
jgi:imidazole glycerol phosphate synthase subunit HisF